jgi:hypothetical protein
MPYTTVLHRLAIVSYTQLGLSYHTYLALVQSRLAPPHNRGLPNLTYRALHAPALHSLTAEPCPTQPDLPRGEVARLHVLAVFHEYHLVALGTDATSSKQADEVRRDEFAFLLAWYIV